jgi:putrescine importer
MSVPTGSESIQAAGEAPSPTDTQDGNSEGHLRRVLGVPSLVLFGLVYMVPLTVFTTYGIVTQMTGGRLPTA